MNVSIIIPLCSQTDTIAKSILTLRAQTFSNWEAIVVGGEHSQLAAAADAIAQDSRFRIVRQPSVEFSKAMNAGAKLARYKWLLFLDPKDRLLPELLERLTQSASAEPSFDAVYCKWAYLSPDGEQLDEEFWGQSGDLFSMFASLPAFPLHACIVRASVFQAVGGFDTKLTTCEDWDLWQRISRIGARFGWVDEALALVAMRPDWRAANLPTLLAEGLDLIALGQAPDPRVSALLPPHADGLAPEQAPTARFVYACGVAGLALGRGDDARPLLGALATERAPGLDPYTVAISLYTAALRAAGQGPAGWSDLWPKIERSVGDFLAALETQSQSVGLARRVSSRLERIILEQAALPRPLTIGATHSVAVEISVPIPDVWLAEPIERLHCVITAGGERLGTIELPVCNGMVPSDVLTDAIAAQYAWPILGWFFEQTVYRELTIKRQSDGVSLYQGSECLAAGLPSDTATFWKHAHDQIGWNLLQQQLWGDRKPASQPRLSHTLQASSPQTGDRYLELEVAEPLADLTVAGKDLTIIPFVGGVALGAVAMHAYGKVIATQELRDAITAAAGFELCRAAVREGVLGKPPTAPALRARLAEAARLRRNPVLAPQPSGSDIRAYDSIGAEEHELADPDAALLLMQRAPTAIGTSASRRARLPVAAASELAEAAAVAGEPVVAAPFERLVSVRYMPDMIQQLDQISHGAKVAPGQASEPKTAGISIEAGVRMNGHDQLNGSSGPRRAVQLEREPSRVTRQAARIRRTIAKTARHARKLRSPVYRGQIMRRAQRMLYRVPRVGKKIIRLAQPVFGFPKFKPVVGPGGDLGARTSTSNGSAQLPILMYHRVAPSGVPAMSRFRVTPGAFEAQLRYLRDSGYHSITLDEWRGAVDSKRPIAGRPIMLTFDDGYVDFLTYAWPLLKKYGFSATVFLVADHVGRSNDWDHIYGEAVPLLGWDKIHWLQAQGVVFGSHTASHRPLTALSAEQVVQEAARSRAILARELSTPINAIAYPYGDIDPPAQHLIGACGYTFGLSCRPGLSTLNDSLLSLPRVEVTGDDSVQTFAAKLLHH